MESSHRVRRVVKPTPQETIAGRTAPALESRPKKKVAEACRGAEAVNDAPRAPTGRGWEGVASPARPARSRSSTCAATCSLHLSPVDRAAPSPVPARPHLSTTAVSSRDARRRRPIRPARAPGAGIARRAGPGPLVVPVVGVSTLRPDTRAALPRSVALRVPRPGDADLSLPTLRSRAASARPGGDVTEAEAAGLQGASSPAESRLLGLVPLVTVHERVPDAEAEGLQDARGVRQSVPPRGRAVLRARQSLRSALRRRSRG